MADNIFNQFDRSPEPTLQQRTREADLIRTQGATRAAQVSTNKTSALLPAEVRRQNALAVNAELTGEKLKMALDKAKRFVSDRPAPEDLPVARDKIMVELKNALKAKELSQTMFGASGAGNSFTSPISGSPAASVKALLLPIKANIAFTTLQKMRQSSPTGGALGNVSDKEGELLYSSEASIDPSAGDKVFQGGLDTIIRNRVKLLVKLGEDPSKLASVIPPSEMPALKDEFKSYRFVPSDTSALQNYVSKTQKDGTYDPVTFSSLVGEAYLNATGRKPDDAFFKSAYDTGLAISKDPAGSFKDFDYTEGDKAVQAAVSTGAHVPEKLGLGETLSGAAINAIPSTLELAGNTVKALTVDLPETLEGVAKIVGGATGLSDPSTYEALKNYYSDRYGSIEGFKHALRDDPASIAADVAGVLTGGGTLMAKGLGVAAKVTKIGELASAARFAGQVADAGAAIDPLRAASSLIKTGASGIKKSAETAILDLPARYAGVTGSDVKQAFGAGTRGSEDFTNQMHQTGDVLDPIDKTKSALGELFNARGANYERRMAKMGKSEQLDFKDVDDTLDKVHSIGTHKGIDISSASGVWDQINNKVNEFKDAGLSSIEDFDALKRSVSAIGQQYQLGTPQYRVAKQVATSLGDTIKQKAPIYSNIMNDYRVASDTINDAVSTLGTQSANHNSLLIKLRKANSGTGPTGRNILDLLEQMPSGKGLGDMLAGQALRSEVASGLPSALTGTTALATGSPEVLASTLITPRNLGEMAYSLGQKYGPVKRAAQAFGELSPIKTASELYKRYNPDVLNGVTSINPLVQGLINPVDPNYAKNNILPLREKYKDAFPRVTLGRSFEKNLDQYRNSTSRTGVSLDQLRNDPPEESVSPTLVPVEENVSPAAAQSFAQGGLVPAPFSRGGRAVRR